MTPESVLCSRADDLPAGWLLETLALALPEDALWKVLQALAPVWLPRSEAEHDERFVQWIPYLLLRDSAGRLAAYPRQGADTRLHGRWSLGVGGHINPEDAPETRPTSGIAWRELLHRGLRRELAEEFPGAASETVRFLGLIHERRSAVGRVHIGAVFVVEILHEPGSPGAELDGLTWVPATDLGGREWPWDRFELWSRLAWQLAYDGCR